MKNKMFKVIDNKLINLNEIVSVEPIVKIGSMISEIYVEVNFKNNSSINLYNNKSRPKTHEDEQELKNKSIELFEKVIEEIDIMLIKE